MRRYNPFILVIPRGFSPEESAVSFLCYDFFSSLFSRAAEPLCFSSRAGFTDPTATVWVESKVGPIARKLAAQRRDDVRPARERRVEWEICLGPQSGDTIRDMFSSAREGSAFQ